MCWQGALGTCRRKGRRKGKGCLPHPGTWEPLELLWRERTGLGRVPQVLTAGGSAPRREPRAGGMMRSRRPKSSSIFPDGRGSSSAGRAAQPALSRAPVRAVGPPGLCRAGSEWRDEPVVTAGVGSVPRPGLGGAQLPAGSVDVWQRRVGRGGAAAVEPGGGWRRGRQHDAPRRRVQLSRAAR